MTTLELIERGIGHNCLSDAYDMGRADAEAEHKAMCETCVHKVSKSDIDAVYQQGRADKYQEIVSEYMLLTEEQVNQIRADAIKEFVTRFEYENITDANSERLKPFIYEMHRLAEQMQKGAEQ